MKNLLLPLLGLMTLTFVSCSNDTSLTFNGGLKNDNQFRSTTHVTIKDKVVSIHNEKNVVNVEKTIASTMDGKDNLGDEYTKYTFTDGSQYFDMRSKTFGRRGAYLEPSGKRVDMSNTPEHQTEINFDFK